VQRLVRVTVPEEQRGRLVPFVASLPWVSSFDVAQSMRVVPSRGDEAVSGVAVATVVISFKVRGLHLGPAIKALKLQGVGGEFGAIDVLDVRASSEQLPRVDRGGGSACCPSMHDRLSTMEIDAAINSDSHLTADHCFFAFIASLIAAVGMLTNSSSVVLSASFLSPLMTMLLAATWGLCVHDAALVRRAARNAAMDAAICLGVGAAAGLFVGAILPYDRAGLETPVTHTDRGGSVWSTLSINTTAILALGPPMSNVALSSVVAVLSGIGVALGYSGGTSSALAGVAMSASLLPPLVNTGLMCALAVFYPEARNLRGDSLPRIAGFSLCIYAVNVFFIVLFAVITLKLKRVGGATLRAAKRNFAPTPAARAW
ncbi:hypothetical protein M885DRAFT_423692, partial [Pelagophyceae sp. CCMP2097]